MDWVHCNTCFVQPGSSSRKFVLTNCGHVFCHECIQDNPSTCNLCKTQCNVIPLTSNLKPDVEIFFMDPADLLKKHQKQYLQVLEFQKSHRKRLISHLQKSIDQGTDSSQSNHRWQEMERELKKFMEENIMLKKMIGAMNGDPKMRGTSSRPGTPLNRGVSPGPNTFQQRVGHFTPSGHNQTSPYSRSAPVTPQMMKSSQRDTPKTPAGPIRLTIRTPPSNGMLGRIGTPPSGRLHNTSGIVANLIRAGNTPGAREAKTTTGRSRVSTGETRSATNSPTRHSQISDSNSNSSQSRHWLSGQQNISTSADLHNGSAQQTSSYSSQNVMPRNQHHQTAKKPGNPSADNRRQIQLHYQPRQSSHQ